MNKKNNPHPLYGSLYPCPRYDQRTHTVVLEDDQNIALRERPAWAPVSENQGGPTERLKGRIIRQIPKDVHGVEVINEGIGYNLEWCKVRIFTSNLPTPEDIADASIPDYYEGYMYKPLLRPIESVLPSAPMKDPHGFSMPSQNHDEPQASPPEETRQQRRERVRRIARNRLSVQRVGELDWENKPIGEVYDEPMYDTVRVPVEISAEAYESLGTEEAYSMLVNNGTFTILRNKGVVVSRAEVESMNNEKFIFGQLADFHASERPDGIIKGLVQLDTKYILSLLDSQSDTSNIETHEDYDIDELVENIECVAEILRGMQGQIDRYCGRVTGFHPENEAEQLLNLLSLIRQVYQMNHYANFREGQDDRIEIGWDSQMNIVMMTSISDGRSTMMTRDSLQVFRSDDAYAPRIMMYFLYARDICREVIMGDWSFIRFANRFIEDGLVHIQPGPTNECATSEFDETPVMTESRYSLERLLLDSADFRNSVHREALTYVAAADEMTDLNNLLLSIETPDNAFGRFLDRVDIHTVIQRAIDCIENKIKGSEPFKKSAALANSVEEYKNTFVEKADQANRYAQEKTDLALDILNQMPPADIDFDYEISPDERFNYVDALAGSGLPEVPTLTFPDEREIEDLLSEFGNSIADAIQQVVMSAAVDLTKSIIEMALSACEDLEDDAVVSAVDIKSNINSDNLEGVIRAISDMGFKNIDLVSLLDDISAVLNAREICLLFMGTPSSKVLDLCLSVVSRRHRNLSQRLGTEQKIRRDRLKMFFKFIGEYVGTSEFCASVLEVAPSGRECSSFDSYALRRSLLKEREILTDKEIDQQIQREKDKKRTILNNMKTLLREGLTPKNMNEMCNTVNGVLPDTDPTLDYAVDNAVTTLYSGIINMSDKDLATIPDSYSESEYEKTTFVLATNDSGNEEIEDLRQTQIQILKNVYNVTHEPGQAEHEIWKENRKVFTNYKEILDTKLRGTKPSGTIQYYTEEELQTFQKAGFGFQLPYVEQNNIGKNIDMILLSATGGAIGGYSTEMIEKMNKIIDLQISKIDGGATGTDIYTTSSERTSLGVTEEEFERIHISFHKDTILRDADEDFGGRYKIKSYLQARKSRNDNILEVRKNAEIFAKIKESSVSNGDVRFILPRSLKLFPEIESIPSNTLSEELVEEPTLAPVECDEDELSPPSTVVYKKMEKNKILLFEEDSSTGKSKLKEEYITKIDISTDYGTFIKDQLLEGFEDYRLEKPNSVHMSIHQYALLKLIRKNLSDLGLSVRSGMGVADVSGDTQTEKMIFGLHSKIMDIFSSLIAEKSRTSPFFKTVESGEAEESTMPLNKGKTYVMDYLDFSKKEPPCPDQEPVDYIGLRREKEAISLEASSLCASTSYNESGISDSELSFISSIVRTTVRVHVLDYFFRNIFHHSVFGEHLDNEPSEMLVDFLTKRLSSDMLQMDAEYHEKFYYFIEEDLASKNQTAEDVIREMVSDSIDHVFSEFDRLYSFTNQSTDFASESISIFDPPTYSETASEPDHLITNDEGTYYNASVNSSQMPLFIEKYVKVQFWTSEDEEYDFLDGEHKDKMNRYSTPEVIMSMSEFKNYMSSINEDLIGGHGFYTNPQARKSAPLGVNEKTSTDECGDLIEFDKNNIPHFKSVSVGHRIMINCYTHEIQATTVLPDGTIFTTLPSVVNENSVLYNEPLHIAGINRNDDFSVDIGTIVLDGNPSIYKQNKIMSVVYKDDPFRDYTGEETYFVFRPLQLCKNETDISDKKLSDILEGEFLNSTVEGNLDFLYASNEYKAITDFIFPVQDMIEAYSIMTIMNATANQEISLSFRSTKGSLKNLFFLMSDKDPNRLYEYEDPSLAAIGGQEGLKKLAEEMTGSNSYNIAETIRMNPGLGLEYIAKAMVSTARGILKSQAETRDPNIALSKQIQDLALQSGAEVPILPISLLALLPSNIFIPPFGWGPPISGLGFAYHAAGLGYFKSRYGGSQQNAPESRGEIEQQIQNAGLEIRNCPTPPTVVSTMTTTESEIAVPPPPPTPLTSSELEGLSLEQKIIKIVNHRSEGISQTIFWEQDDLPPRYVISGKRNGGNGLFIVPSDPHPQTATEAAERLGPYSNESSRIQARNEFRTCRIFIYKALLEEAWRIMVDREELTLPWSEELSGTYYRTPISLEIPILTPGDIATRKRVQSGFDQRICGSYFNVSELMTQIYDQEQKYRYNIDSSSPPPRQTVINIIQQILILESEMEHNPTFALREEGRDADGSTHSPIPGHTGRPFSQRSRWSEESDEE